VGSDKVNLDQLPPISIPALLRKYGLRPSKGLGQNFLVDENALRKIVTAAEITSDDFVLEVGPGLGSLTRYLAATAQTVVAVELDDRMLPTLHETLAPFENVQIVLGDILEQDPTKLLELEPKTRDGQSSSVSDPRSYKVVANIPYYITSALIRHLLEAKDQPQSMILTVQQEVARRICEQPPNMSLLTLSVQVYGEPKIAVKIPAGAFYPPPKVDSAVVKIDLYSEPQIPAQLLPLFFRLAKAGFAQKRKTLNNTLSAGLQLPKDQTRELLNQAEIDPQRRAQTLSLAEWRKLTECAAARI
jgi:16S rRNA (adenine1518-N6/adenine1519-N6)-dimethyltransferase